MNFNRISGFSLLLIGLIGYFTIADDLRHTGEFIGVTCIVISSLILVAGSYNLRLLKYLHVRWIAAGILSGIIIGGALDNMFIGETIGFSLFTIIGLMLMKKSKFKKIDK